MVCKLFYESNLHYYINVITDIVGVIMSFAYAYFAGILQL